jgi:AbrB family looped-hinge helix DNA binding protein
MGRTIRFQRSVRRAGGSLQVTIPPEIQRELGLKEGESVDVYLDDGGRIVVERGVGTGR